MNAIVNLYSRQQHEAPAPLARDAVLYRLQRSRSDAAPERDAGWLSYCGEQLLDSVNDDAAAAAFAADNQLTDTLQRRFEVYAQINPGAVAVKTPGMQVTFGELDAQADGLAVLLQQRGLGPGSLCVIDIAPSVALARAVVAVLKAGAVAALPGAAPAAGKPLLVLTVAAAEASDPLCRGCAEDGAGLPYAWPQEYPTHRLSPAFALRSASANGTPQLSTRSHLAIIGDLLALQRVQALGHGDALLLNPDITPSTFPWELLWPLSHGARLVVPAAAELADPGQLRRLIRRERITVMHLVPVLRGLLRQAPEELADLDSLRAVFCASPAAADPAPCL
ncbi:AMP-binding protein [Duganella aceris]|uniref:AMP-binding protein n=1 Tax=Duganella aceris TaxID=2703883 RepID=A0ABX0FLG6_9BURK|nr:AMP-binding protein [Duganella aceris]NGZ85357.1 AMP-binding protein [Duganella aceris]